MFGKNGNTPKNNSKSSTNTTSSLEVCNIALGTTIEGSFKAEANIRLEGSIYGNVSCSGRIVMSKNAYIKGDIICQNIVSEGKVEGNIVAKEKVHLFATAIVEGNIKYTKLQIEEGAIFNGQAMCAKSTTAPSIKEG
ncbi:MULTISPECIES: polymer-forming cytoskeletal protein [unclassified Aureispira]|uniref:bactofilin family protein n=1 Tax=unclassified Aureispira TaxID=2649989 RepID=UPI0006979399|nr:MULTISPECIES: polymer-forming cytoskeletal protein [unclassified Aureispira]WMX12578.1 polymer-forming cytoskeletal protein [Aureispira sp. CCB-E]